MCYDALPAQPASPPDHAGGRDPARIALLVVIAALVAGFVAMLVAAAYPVPGANCAVQASVDHANAAYMSASHWLGAGFAIVACAFIASLCGTIAAAGWRRYFALTAVAEMVGGALLLLNFISVQGLFGPCARPFS